MQLSRREMNQVKCRKYDDHEVLADLRSSEKDEILKKYKNAEHMHIGFALYNGAFLNANNA